MREVEEIDAKISKNKNLGPLAGVFIKVKDNICTSHVPSTDGSRNLGNYWSLFNARVVKRVKDYARIIVRKTNLDEFGMGSTMKGSTF